MVIQGLMVVQVAETGSRYCLFIHARPYCSASALSWMCIQNGMAEGCAKLWILLKQKAHAILTFVEILARELELGTAYRKSIRDAFFGGVAHT